MRKIGIFLGNFDPPTICHQNIIRNVVNYDLLDEIFIVPKYRSIKEPYSTLFTDRATMCKRAFKPFKKVTISNMESLIASTDKKIYREGVPSWKTIECFKNIKDIELYIITTYSGYSKISNWDKGEEILKNNKFIILCEVKDLGKLPGDIISIPLYDHINITSNKVRNYIRLNSNPFPLVQKDVLDYIYKHNLYIE